MNTSDQSLFDFEQIVVQADAAKCEAQLAAERHAREAKTAAKILVARQRELRRAEEQMAKNTRRWKREEKARAKNDTLTAQCGINWYSRRRDAGIFWTHCRTCGQLLIYTDDKNTQPQVCAGRKHQGCG